MLLFKIIYIWVFLRTNERKKCIKINAMKYKNISKIFSPKQKAALFMFLKHIFNDYLMRSKVENLL